MRVIPLSLADALQYSVIGVIQGFRQFIQILAEVWGDAVLQRVQLAKYPSEPVQQCKNLKPAWDSMTPHIPSALSVSVSITRFLSSALHLLIAVLGDELTTL